MSAIDFQGYARRYNNIKDFDRHLLYYKFLALKEHREKLGNVLELGCAMGLMTELILPISRTLDVVDASDEYVRHVKRSIARKFPKRKSDVRFFTSLFERYEPDRNYDTIILSGVLPALPNPPKFLRRVAQWLKRGGALYITSHNAYSLHRRVGHAMGLVKNVHALSERDIKLFGHRKVYDLDSLSRDVERSGLRVSARGGVYLKPLPNRQMERLTNGMIRAFYEVGKDVDPALCAELYVFARK